MCGVSREEPDGDMDARAAMRCSLPGFDPSRWNADACPGAAHQAEMTLSSLIYGAEQQGVHLDHDLDRDGCPWGWALSTFAASVAKYSEPRNADSPVRRDSARLWLREPKADARLLHWVSWLEDVEDGAYGRYREVRCS